MRVFVAGATGVIGQHLVPGLVTGIWPSAWARAAEQARAA